MASRPEQRKESLGEKRIWLMKSEPDVYSIDQLEEDGTTHWEGVRNYQARNFMREMKVGDPVLFYHSNASPPGIAGVAKVVKEAYPDHTAWEAGAPYHDPKSSPDNPRWDMVDVAFVERFPTFLSLPELRELPALEGMELLRKGSRLSVMPVSEEHFNLVLQLGRRKS